VPNLPAGYLAPFADDRPGGLRRRSVPAGTEIWRLDATPPDAWDWTGFTEPRYRFDPESGAFRSRYAGAGSRSFAQVRLARRPDPEAGSRSRRCAQPSGPLIPNARAGSTRCRTGDPRVLSAPRSYAPAVNALAVTHLPLTRPLLAPAGANRPLQHQQHR